MLYASYTLFIGANPVARMIARALNENGFGTLVTDGSWTNIKSARMEGIDTYYGNAVSEYADRHLDLIGLGKVLTLTPQKELNALAGQRYRSEFGSNNVYFLSTEAEKESSEQISRTAVSHDYHVLFSGEITYPKLASLISQGAKPKQTNISDSFTYQDYQEQYGKRATPLFAFNAKRQLRFFTSEEELIPESGWTLTSLIQETPDDKE